MDQKNEAVIVTKPSFQAVGLRWEGTFAQAQAGEIRNMYQELRDRWPEIRHVLNPEKLLGLSYHVNPGGFIHYASVEVSAAEQIPEGMAAVSVPELIYAKCAHPKEQNIDRSYNNLYDWIEEQGYSRQTGAGLTHYEEYPRQQDSHDPAPEFTIMIPISAKTK